MQSLIDWKSVRNESLLIDCLSFGYQKLAFPLLPLITWLFATCYMNEYKYMYQTKSQIKRFKDSLLIISALKSAISCCGYLLELPLWGLSNKYPQHNILIEKFGKIFHNYPSYPPFLELWLKYEINKANLLPGFWIGNIVWLTCYALVNKILLHQLKLLHLELSVEGVWCMILRSLLHPQLHPKSPSFFISDKHLLADTYKNVRSILAVSLNLYPAE